MVFLAFFSISKQGDRCYSRFGTFWGPKNLFLMPKNTKKRIWIFCLFLRVELTSWHKNSSKTLSNTPKMVQNYIKGVNIYIGRPSKKKNQKIWTQGKSCFFTVNATIRVWNVHICNKPMEEFIKRKGLKITPSKCYWLLFHLILVAEANWNFSSIFLRFIILRLGRQWLLPKVASSLQIVQSICC